MSVQISRASKRKIAKGFFITGTDTNVGKTIVAASLSLALMNRGVKVCAIKPLASGGNKAGNMLLNSDVLMLKQYSTKNDLSYRDINPFSFQDPVAPNLAAKNSGIRLSVARIIKKTYRALTNDADYIVIEGAGGFLTPINNYETMKDLAKSYGYPVILVVGIKLGCINHTFLTYQCMKVSGIKMAGWVANVIDRKMLCLEENIEFIMRVIDIPLLRIIPYINNISPEKVYRSWF